MVMDMNDKLNEKLKDVFDQVQAEEDLKEKTRAFLARKTRGYKKSRTINYKYLIPAAACLIFVLFAFGGYWLYFTPTADISVDINPSIELGINRFDKVVSVSSYNDDGQELLDSINIKYMDYTEAVDQILASENIAALLDNDAVMTITVVCSDGSQSARLLSGVESCTEGQKNTHCYCADSDEVSQAHHLGLSYGKYRAYLELQALDPDITPEEIQGMTMREIRDLIESLSDDDEAETQTESNGYHKNGNGHGHGNQSNSGAGGSGGNNSANTNTGNNGSNNGDSHAGNNRGNANTGNSGSNGNNAHNAHTGNNGNRARQNRE